MKTFHELLSFHKYQLHYFPIKYSAEPNYLKAINTAGMLLYYLIQFTMWTEMKGTRKEKYCYVSIKKY